MMNGGSKEYRKLQNPSRDIKKFYKEEIPNFHEALVEKHAKLFEEHKKAKLTEGKEHNIEASFMNIILCDIEILSHLPLVAKMN